MNTNTDEGSRICTYEVASAQLASVDNGDKELLINVNQHISEGVPNYRKSYSFIYTGINKNEVQDCNKVKYEYKVAE